MLLGPVLFSVGIQQTLADLQSKFSETRVLAYLDDVFTTDHVLAAFTTLPEFSKIGLRIQEEKCEIYCPPHLQVSISSMSTIPVTSEGFKILGIPVGKTEFVSRSCSTIAEGGSELRKQLVDLDNVQGAMLLLRYCHTTRLNHLAQGVYPETLEPAAIIHDQQTKSTFTILLRFGNISDPSWVQATLPVRLGGIGLISLQKISPFAYLLGWAHSLQSFPDRFPDLRHQVSNLLASSHQEPSIGHSSHRSYTLRSFVKY